ncbi:stAR-related lipid transfer protein 9 [Sardina pilchardus]|uniref:stAR-related lipid transfer protein 9 n=1 Tax=Sardina pilchardus TaxID=27697 RepID=UPI002E13135B
MANVKVAIRVRPLNSRESVDGGETAVQVEDKVVRIKNMKPLSLQLEGRADSRERLMEFGFDYCYWSVDPEGPNYASQEEVFQDLGVSVLAGASEGYNVCLFAYGQTGSGKTYTMIGTPDSMGLTPRICQGLFRSGEDSPDEQSSCRVEVSFLEIYNERVRDLLRGADQKKPAVLRVREHPETGPYVQGLSKHQVTDYKQTLDLLERGIGNRITAATHIHDASSRSHAIFTIQYTQATLENNLPSEIVSKINLVDLAGSERADPHYCRDRITEGANINKSLVTLGIVISALAQNSQMFSSCQSINSVASEGEGSLGGSVSSSLSAGSGRRHCYIPYRDSVLTWLLKDSLGGNSKTIMIATVSPSCSSYNETLSTLRYAAHARNIVNKPRVNEDANVRLIRELREEIDRLKSMLLNFGMRNPSPSLSDEREGSLSDIVLQNELKVDQLTKDWSESWTHKRELLEQYSVDINRDRAGFLVHSLVPHLIALDRDVLSTGVTFYHLREGLTRIGPQGDGQEEPQIVLLGGASCEIENQCGVVTLRPLPGQVCIVNGREVTEPCRLAQGAVISLGQYKFRFNHPAEAALLRERRRTSEGALHCSPSALGPLCADPSVEGTGCPGDAPPPWRRVEEQQRFVDLLHEEIQVEQRKAERDLEMEQAHLRQQQSEIQQWALKQKQRLAAIEQKVTNELGVQTDRLTPPMMDLASEDQDQEGSRPPSVVGDCKQVVQEELLRHHALRRAENRMRRKRLHYQLQRIARKRHLLEAKGELQRLVNSVPPGQEGPSSPESDSGSRRRPLLLRRHSFSADLLSRLYPQHTPIFSQFLRRNKSSEFMSLYQWSTGQGRPSFDDYLQDQPMRGRSHTLPSGYGRGSRSRASSSENLKAPLRERNTPEPGSGKLSGYKAGPSRRGSLPRSRSNSQSKSSEDMTPDTNSKATKKHVPIIGKASLQKNSTKGVKNGGSKGLETIRKVFSRSVGPGIKTALARVFRKPPLGLRTGRAAKPLKAPGKLTVKPGKEKYTLDDTEKQGQGLMKATVSLDNLEQTTAATPQEDTAQRRWHSAEALSPQTTRWEGRQQDLAHWIENLQEEEGNPSDCDSLFSMDSLSSAYAAALAEQLRQEELERGHSETESVGSEMSEDSLVMDSSVKHTTVRPAVRHQQVPHHLLLYSNASQAVENERITGDNSKQQRKEEDVVMEASDEMPVEVYWSLCGSPKVKARTVSVGIPDTDHERQSFTGRVCGDKVESKMSEEPSSCHLTQQSTPRSLSSSSIREPESMLALTDAWSSMDAADSPRIPRPSPGQRAPSHLLKESDRSLSPSSPDLSDHMSESECQSSFSAESTEGENTVLQAERYWESERSAEEPASCFLRTSSEVVLSSGNTLTLASEEMVSESAELRTLTEVMLSSGNTLTLASEEMVSASDELINSQNDEEEPRHIQAEVLQQEEVLVRETQLMDRHVPGAIDEMIWSKKTPSVAASVPNKVDTVDSEYMPATKQSKSMDLTSNSIDAAVGHEGESVTVCLVSNAHANSQGSASATLGNVAEVIKKHEAKESVHIVNSMSLDSCDVEHHVHDKPQAGLTLKSTLKGIHDQCLPVNSSHYLQPTASGSPLTFDLIEQSLFDVPKAQIHHSTKADVIGSPGGGRGESTESIIAHAVEDYIETTCKEIPADTKDFPVSIKAQQAKDVLDNLHVRHVTQCTAAETIQNQESEPHDITCRKSRKRIKGGQDACTSTLKFPKRCHSSPEKPIPVTPNKTDKDLKDSSNTGHNQSFSFKQECFVENKLGHEEKYIFKLNTAEKNIENEVKTTAHANPRSFGTNYSCIINEKISEVVQEHLKMSVDSGGDHQHLFSVTNSGSTKSLKEISIECTQQQHSADIVQDYCLPSSQTVSLSPQCLKLNQNDITKDLPSCSDQQDFGSLQVVKDQTGCGSKEVNAHMDTKSLRSSAGRTSEESLNKGLSVFLQQDIPEELQMDSSKSKRDIMLATLKEAGKAVQSDICNISAKLGKGTLSAGSSMQHTESLKVANTEKYNASVMTGQLGVCEIIPPPAVEGAVGESATFAKQHTELLKVANTVNDKASVMTGQLGVPDVIPSYTAESAVCKSATFSIQHTKSLKVANIEENDGSVMIGRGVSESIPSPTAEGAISKSATFAKPHTESLKVANTVRDKASVVTGQHGVSESIPSPDAEGEVGESTTLAKQHTESIKVANTVKDKASVVTGQFGLSESISSPAAEGEVGESTTLAKQHTESFKTANSVKDKASGWLTGQLGESESIPSPTAESAVGNTATFSIQHTKSLKLASIEENDGSVMTKQCGVSESISPSAFEGVIGESSTFAKQHTESLKVANTVKGKASVMTGRHVVSESIPPPAVKGAVGESATFTKHHTESLKVANTVKEEASVMTGQLESIPSPTAGSAIRKSTPFSMQHTKSLKVANIEKNEGSVLTGQCGVSESIPSPTAEGGVEESATFANRHTESLKVANTVNDKASVMTRQLEVSESIPPSTLESAVRKSATFSMRHTKSLEVANIEENDGSVMTGQWEVSESIPSPTAEGAVRKSTTFTKQHTESLKVANTVNGKASVMTRQLGVTELSTTSPTVEAAVGESDAPFVKQALAKNGVNGYDIHPEDNILSVLCPREGGNVHFEQTHVQLQHFNKSAVLADEIHKERIAEPSKKRENSQIMDLSTDLSGLDTKRKYVTSEMCPIDLNGQITQSSHLNNLLKQTETENIWIPEPPTEQSTLIFAQHMPNSQDNQSRHSHSTSNLTEYTAQNLNKNGKTFSSQMTVKAPQQRITDTHPCSESSIGNSKTLKYQEILQGHASIQQCPFDKTTASNSSSHLLNTEGNTVGEDSIIQRGVHNCSALSSSCHRLPESNAVLQAQTGQQREHFQHAELNVSHLSQTSTKQLNTQGPKYINTIDLEISCNGKHSPGASEDMFQSARQLSSQEKSSFLPCKKTVQQSPQVTSNLKVPSEVSVDVCGLRRTQWQLSKGAEDSDSRDDSNLSGDTSRLALTKPRDCRDTRIAGNQKMKTKKFRRAQAMAAPSSSSESVPDSSSTESIPVKMRQYRSSARTKPELQTGKREESRHVRLGPQFTEDQKSKTRSIQSQTSLERKVNESSGLQSPNSRVSLTNAKLSSATVTTQQHDDKQSFVFTQKEHRPTETLNSSEKKDHFSVVSPVNANHCKITDDTHLKHILNLSKQLSDTQLDNDMLKKEDATMQFASIDINPFIHPWQDTEPNKATYKNQVFGSAAEICSKYPLLNCPDKQMTRCCSVDNGLNVQNSPFNSHLRTYANSRGLSSTLSSVEDFKEQVATQSHVMACRQSSLDENGQNLTTASCSSSYSGASGDLGNSSGQVDEIMLVYPSQQESQGLGNQSISMCDHSTQTITQGGDVKRRRCHHRSSTQVETTLQGKVPATWASLQNMSAHLSELIHNTSDLLGNIQCMRSGSVQRQEHFRKTRHPNQTSIKDGSTQTTLDIGIQTEEVDHTKNTHKGPVTDSNSKAHEVNVIVKVIGPNSLTVSEGDDITLSLYDRGSGRFSENIKSMPDLRENRSRSSGRLHSKGTPLKVPSLETVLPSDSHITPDVSPVFPKDLNFDKVSPSGFGLSTIRKCSSQIDVPENQTPFRRTRNYSCKQVSFTDRASSPILTVEAGVGGRDRRTSTPYHDSAERHNHTEKQIHTSKMTSPRTEQLQTTSTKNSPGEQHDYDLRKTYSSSDISIGTISTGHISDLSKSTSDVSNGSSTNSQIKSPNSRTFPHRNTSEKGTGQSPFQTPPCPQNLNWVPSLSQSTSSYQQPLHDRQQRQLFSSFDNQRGLDHHVTETPHRVPDNLRTFWNGPFELADTRQQHTLEYQDDDLMSVAPSECNTDVLVSINPLTENRSPEKQHLIPYDLPLHNKFSNWSGLSQQQPPRLIASPQRLDNKGTSMQNPQRKHVLSESLSSSFNLDPGVHKDNRMREIERLRKEREKVMASVHLEMNPHQLTVEMAEAKLHYGLGETDALLKVLKSGPREQSPPLTKQHLYDKHRKSIEGLKQEREARLQTCRRARSLSPSKHGSVSSRDPDSSPKISDTPTRRREYLQQLRQEVVETSRVPEPPRREGQCPSEIEILLRDYSRAREEARTEIARARDRLRERTEQEKRRLQQQTLSQVVRDDLRTRNRVSNSTLCTGSSLSLASSPTSGYNSSNPAIIRDMQVTTGVLEMGSKVVARPPTEVASYSGGSQSMRSQRTWTSAQDIRLESQGSGSDPRPSNSPSSIPSLRPRALSFGSPSSLATAYQDIASHALTHALAEVRLASAGELRNLLAGKSAAGWRHQGSERGVQVFHKPGPRATVHGFLGAMELQRPVESLRSVIRDHSKAHLYNSSVSSSWTRALDEHTQLVYMLSHPSSFNLKQPRDFCCISTEAKQDKRWVMAMQSVYEESLPRPSVDAVRAEVLPSAWILQPSRKHGQEHVTVIYMLQVDLGPPAIPHRLLGAIARKQASVIAELDAFFSL